MSSKIHDFVNALSIGDEVIIRAKVVKDRSISDQYSLILFSSPNHELSEVLLDAESIEKIK